MANAFNQFASGFEEGNAMVEQFAKQRAGNALAAGDYGGAANALYRSGQLDAGSQVQGLGEAHHKQEIADRITFFKQAAGAISQIPDDGTQTARKVALQHLTPTFKAMGIDDGTIGQLQQTDLSDASLRAFGASLDKEAFTLSQGQTRFSSQGHAIASVAPEQKYVTLAEGAKAVPIPGTGATPADSAAPTETAPAPSAAPIADPAAAVDGEVKSIGATITSGLRSPAHNAQVGGVPNSEHLTGQARDIVPPPNMTLAELGADIQRRVPGAKVLVEKDHVHVQWRGAGLAAAAPAHSDPPGTLYGNPKEQKPDETPLSPAAVAMVGQQYLSLGPPALQNMGQGKVGVANKNAVMEWVAKTAREAGTSNPQLVARFAQNKANVAALSQNTKSLTAVSASEHTLDANLDYAMTFAKRGVGPTGLPMFDTPINKLRIALGSTDAKNLDNLLTTTGNEYARILTTATGTGGAATSDSAREEAHKLLHSGMTLRQLTEAIKIAKTEAANRKASYVTENARLTSEISGIPQAAPAAPAGSSQPHIRRYNPANGRLE